MIVRLKERPTQEDIEVCIRYSEKTPLMDRLVTAVRTVECKVHCTRERGELWLSAADICYVESVDKKTFVYCENAVHQTDGRLYQLEEALRPAGFVQISKFCLLNLSVLVGIRPLLNSRMEATLTNGERVTVTRRYLSTIRERLKGGKLA